MLLLGVERVAIVPDPKPTLRLDFISYPITHSLVTGLVGGLLFGALYFLFSRDKRGALIAAVLVPSHWFLDFFFHIPDLPLWPGGPKVGLGLWRSVPVTFMLEALFLAVGLVLYLRTTRAKDRIGSYALWSFIGVLVAIYVSSMVGPPPTDSRMLAVSALSLWLLIPWAYWIDAHRTVVRPRD
jgi:membrane-bound metal-dependent hydrolase YbcI (DUF457 family)